MDSKYLYIILSGGLNDRMSNIYRSYKYCKKTNRTLLVNFEKTYFTTSSDYNINLINILSFKQDNIICDSNKISTILYENRDSISRVETPVYKLYSIKKDWKDKVIVVLGRGWCNVQKKKEKNGKGGCGNENKKLFPSMVFKFFFDSIKLNQNIKKYCKKNFKTLPKNYSVIQIRNTDRSTDYNRFLKSKIKHCSKYIYIATDSQKVLQNIKKQYSNYNFINYTEFPDKDLPLHKSNLDCVTKLRDVFLDLYICSRATNFFINSPGRFALLCKFVQQNKTKIG